MHADPLLSFGLTLALRQEPDFELADSEGEPLRTGHAVDVVVVDYRTGLRLAEQARRSRDARLRSRIVVLTTNDRECEVCAALQLGVHGYLLQSCSIEELASGVRAVGRGSRYLCQAVAQRVADCLAHEALTTRETQVLHLMAQGECNKEIARQLEIAAGTVKTHVKAIMDKLRASNRTHAVSMAVARGLVKEPSPATTRSRTSVSICAQCSTSTGVGLRSIPKRRGRSSAPSRRSAT
jgi:DNA-binding NarL/FixJ family response regulator